MTELQPQLSHAKRRRRRWLILFALLIGSLLALFVVNGVLLGHGETPFARTTGQPAAEPGPTVKIMAYNIAKCFVYEKGAPFESKRAVTQRVDELAAVIRGEQPDLVFVSEAVLECTPCPVNQVRMLADKTGMHAWAFGENFNVGLPFCRMVGGNAILSRWPLQVVANPSLAGRQPFYVAKNNRRVLWCQTTLAGRPLLLASIHNDSFDLANNRKQMQQILDYAGPRDAILAGDFNAEPHDPSIQLIRDSKRFAGVIDGLPTYPSDQPSRQIDFIFVPAGWELLDWRVLDTQVSDHRPVVSVFRPMR